MKTVIHISGPFPEVDENNKPEKKKPQPNAKIEDHKASDPVKGYLC
jgi:hypothetical protein